VLHIDMVCAQPADGSAQTSTGGGARVTWQPCTAATQTPTITATPTITPTFTSMSTGTPTPVPTATLTFTGTGTATPTLTGTVTPTGIPTVTSTPTPTASWYDVSWPYRQSVTVNHMKVTNTSQSDFPVYLNLADMQPEFFAHASSDGCDLRMTAGDGTTEIPIELVTFSGSDATGELWFKGTLSHTADTRFYLYYGNAEASCPPASSIYGSQNVWDAGFRAVYHLKDGSVLSAVDSTSHGYDGTVEFVTAATGQIDGGAAFDGGSGHDISIPTSAMLPSGTMYTISAWAKLTDVIVNRTILDSRGGVDPWPCTQGAVLYVDTAGHLVSYQQYSNPYPGTELHGLTPIADGHWHLLASRSDGSTLKLFVNGAQDATANSSFWGFEGKNGWIGRACDTASNVFAGRLDEVHVSTVSRSVDWLATEYNNQASSTTFYSVGAEEVD